jgi:hypothetical protein
MASPPSRAGIVEKQIRRMPPRIADPNLATRSQQRLAKGQNRRVIPTLVNHFATENERISGVSRWIPPIESKSAMTGEPIPSSIEVGQSKRLVVVIRERHVKPS